MVGWIWTDVVFVGVGVIYGWPNGCIIRCVGINGIGSPRLVKRAVCCAGVSRLLILDGMVCWLFSGYGDFMVPTLS